MSTPDSHAAVSRRSYQFTFLSGGRLPGVMTTCTMALLLALIVSIAMTALVRHFACARGWLEQPGQDSRKIHQRPTPRLGGIAIVAGCAAPLLALLFVDSGVAVMYRAQPQLIVGLLAGGLVIAALGLYDDLRGASASAKLAIQIAVVTALWWSGLRIETIATPIIGHTSLGVLSLPMTLLWVVGVINAMNLIDGLDGLAGGVALFATMTNFALALSRGDVLMCLIMASLAGAVLGFLIFNFNPASIFMGDTGSMFLGFVLATSSITTSQKSGAAIGILVPVLALGLPIMDTLLAITRRALRGRPIFSADKEHIHHRLMGHLAWSHRGTVLALYGLSSVFTLAALGLAYADSAHCAVVLCAVAVVIVVVMRNLGSASSRGAQHRPELRRRNHLLRMVVRMSSERVRAARDISTIWDALQPIADVLGASRFALDLDYPGVPAPGRVSFEITRSTTGDSPLDISVDAVAAGVKVGRICASWRDGRGEVDRDHELALQSLAQLVARMTIRVTGVQPFLHDNAILRPTSKYASQAATGPMLSCQNAPAD
jgi:UDP-GlcNAc:undecaprenyl-phosphate GlcNAc-1-phosphate transferase